MKHMKSFNGEMRSGGTDSRVNDRPKPLARDVIHKLERQTQVEKPTHREHYPPVSRTAPKK